MARLKVSIVTACYNSASTIEDTIRSVILQEYAQIEYIIIDGGSTDGTLDIVKKYASRISKVFSGKDGGIYSALNKGIAAATGDIVAILHSDDLYADNAVIARVVETFEREKTDCVYGDLQYVDRDNTSRIVRNWKAGQYQEGMFESGWMPPHPAFFTKRACYEKHGQYNTAFRLAGDYELMLRFLHKLRLSVAYLPLVLVKMRTGGLSNQSLGARIRSFREDSLAWRVNMLKPRACTLVRKPFSKLSQFVRR
jgi:glycosyltransferase involved in cell wall biosynthesis